MTTRGLAIDEAAWASPWRHRAVRDKVVLSGGLLACALSLPPWPGGLVAAGVALVVLLGPARVPVDLLGRALATPAAFLLVGSASLLVTVSWQDGPRVGVVPAWGAAVALVTRGLAAVLAVLLLATTTPVVELLAGLRRLRVPAACVEVAGVTYRLLFVLLDSARTIREAQAARLGYERGATAFRSAAGLLAGVVLRAWERVDRLESGLAGRGGTGSLETLEGRQSGSTPFLVAAVAGSLAIAVMNGLVTGAMR